MASVGLCCVILSGVAVRVLRAPTSVVEMLSACLAV